VTTAAAEAKHPTDPLLFRLAHYQALILIALATALVVDHYVRSPLALLVGIGLYAVYGLSVIGTIRHRRGICLACGDAFPLDAQGQAQGRRRRALRTFHLVTDHPGRQMVGIAAVVVLGIWVWWPAVVMWACFAVESWAAYWHRLLEPYCPYCRRRGRGRGEDSPAPVPTPVLSRSA
jgi:hypothetical protein